MLSIIPLVPTLVFAFISLLSSIFVILKICLPVLPPLPFSRRVSPSEFGLPTFRTLSVAHKSNLWLAGCDIVALSFFLWQVIAENVSQTVVTGVPQDPGASIRFAVALTLRQSCLAILTVLTIAHVRMGRSVSLGRLHVSIWGPTLVAVAACVTFAGILANAQVASLFIGLLTYSSTLVIISTVVAAYLVSTLITIRRNLMPAPPISESGPRPSFATEDIDALREGSSWLTSAAGSRRDSMSQWSFSTWHSPLPSSHGSIRDPRLGSSSTLAPKSSFWFTPVGSNEDIPPVPPIPSPYRQNGESSVPKEQEHRRPPKSSGDSWLSSPSVSEASMSAFSYPTTHPHSSNGPCENNNPSTLPHSSRTAVASSPSPLPHLADARVLGGYGHVGMMEKGLSTGTNNTLKDSEVSFAKMILWFCIIWIPFLLSLPALIAGCTQIHSPVPVVFLLLSVTLSSPLLALSCLFKALIPMPTNLFASNQHLKPTGFQSAGMSCGAESVDNGRTRGMSTSTYTVVEGRRSGDIWVAKGEAVTGKGRIGRALTLLQPSPPLSVLPMKSYEKEEVLTPPLPLQMDDSASHPQTPQSAFSAEVGRRQTFSSKASTFYSAVDDSIAFGSKVMVAERHTSTMAKKMELPSSPSKDKIIETPKSSSRSGDHLRSRSVSSHQSVPRDPLTPPPPFPLPPTPGDGIAKFVTMRHKRSQSSGVSSGFSFAPIGDSGSPHIDSLSAGMLPLLLPGVRVGSNVDVRGFVPSSATRRAKPLDAALPNSTSFSSPESHSTPIRSRTKAAHKQHHFSLPSLSLGQDRSYKLWKTETNEALEETARSSLQEVGRRATVLGLPHADLSSNNIAKENVDKLGQVPKFSPRHTHTRAASSLSIYPEGVESARSSLQTLIDILEDEPHRSRSGSNATLVSKDGAGHSAGVQMDSSKSQLSSSSDKENKGHRYHLPARKQSSITYIKSDDTSDNTKRSRLSTNLGRFPASRPTTAQNVLPLTLIPNRDQNMSRGLDTTASTAKSPLSVNKIKTKSSGSGLRPLQLARSATSKARGVLRRTEVLPRVVVRPPSNAGNDFTGFELR